jgi:hypothetical protein
MNHSEEMTMNKVRILCAALVMVVSAVPARALVPVGEDCAHPKDIISLAYTDTCSTCSFGNSSVGITCDGVTSPGADVVYRYAATVDQRAAFSLCGSSFNTLLYIFDGPCVSGNLIACNNNSDVCGPGSNRSYIACMLLHAGHTYYIVVDATDQSREGEGGGDAERCPCGPYRLRITLCGEPPYSTVDMGDLPECKYPTLVSNPAHGLSGVAWLGANATSEASPHSVNTDPADEGVDFQNRPYWTPCHQEQVIVTVTGGQNYAAYADSGGRLYLNGWKDGNHDGDFCDEIPCVGAVVSEWIVRDTMVTPGSYVLDVIDPGVLDSGRYDGVFRWRLTHKRVGRFGFGLSDTSACPQMTCGTFGLDYLGEVEDYVLRDFQLAVEMGDFDAIPGDARITLRWNTLSELSNDRFDIVRDGRTIGFVPSQGNTPSGYHYSFVDAVVDVNTSYTYDLYGVAMDGTRELLATASAIPLGSSAAATEYGLYQNIPNPFNPATEIVFDMPVASFATLQVFNVTGQRVAVLADGLLPSGRHKVTFNAANLPSGMYICRLEAGTYTAAKKMLLMK